MSEKPNGVQGVAGSNPAVPINTRESEIAPAPTAPGRSSCGGQVAGEGGPTDVSSA